MAELPIVVESGLWVGLILGSLVILAALTLGRKVVASIRSGDTHQSIAASALSALFALGLGIFTVVQRIDWQFRLDDKGVVLRAPFDFLRPSGDIAWSDITSVYVARSGNRGLSYKLHIVGKDGTDITLDAIEDLPAQFGPLLQALLAERAPQAKNDQDIAGQLAYARTNASAGISAGYWARDGRGELLK